MSARGPGLDPHPGHSREALEKARGDRDENVRKTAEISLAIHRNPREEWEDSL